MLTLKTSLYVNGSNMIVLIDAFQAGFYSYIICIIAISFGSLLCIATLLATCTVLVFIFLSLSYFYISTILTSSGYTIVSFIY